MTQQNIKELIATIGRSDIQAKREAWIEIGKIISDISSEVRAEVSGNAKYGALRKVRLEEAGIMPAVSPSYVKYAQTLHDILSVIPDHQQILEKIPPQLCSPERMVKAIKVVNAGGDPDKWRKENNAMRLSKYGGGKRKLSGEESFDYWGEGVHFRNLMARLTKMTKEQQEEALGSFFGYTSHHVNLTRLDDGSINISEIDTPDSPVSTAKFDITVRFHEAK